MPTGHIENYFFLFVFQNMSKSILFIIILLFMNGFVTPHQRMNKHTCLFSQFYTPIYHSPVFSFFPTPMPPSHLFLLFAVKEKWRGKIKEIQKRNAHPTTDNASLHLTVVCCLLMLAKHTNRHACPPSLPATSCLISFFVIVVRHTMFSPCLTLMSWNARRMHCQQNKKHRSTDKLNTKKKRHRLRKNRETQRAYLPKKLLGD